MEKVKDRIHRSIFVPELEEYIFSLVYKMLSLTAKISL